MRFYKVSSEQFDPEVGVERPQEQPQHQAEDHDGGGQALARLPLHQLRPGHHGRVRQEAGGQGEDGVQDQEDRVGREHDGGDVTAGGADVAKQEERDEGESECGEEESEEGGKGWEDGGEASAEEVETVVEEEDPYWPEVTLDK